MATSLARVDSIAHATVVLRALDVNDNRPTFIEDHFYATVSENAEIGDIATAGVRAFDIDEVIHADH